jgi:hypothetical protein
MKADFSLARVLIAAMCLSSCGGGDDPPLTPVVTTEIAPDGLDYPDPNTFVQGIEITPLVPTVAKGTPTNYLVIPELPAGLRLRHDGVIFGTPLQATAPATYLVTAGNSAGTSSFGVRITVSGRYTLGGIVNGLTSSGLVLTNNGLDSLTIDSSGPFTFPQVLTAGADYAVSITSQPAGQTCSIAGGSGSLGNANLASIVVTCSANAAKREAAKLTLAQAAGALAPDTSKILYLTCDEDSPESVQGHVLDRATGRSTPLGGVIHRYSGAHFPGPIRCGPHSAMLSPDGNWAYLSDSTTHVVTVYATKPD